MYAAEILTREEFRKGRRARAVRQQKARRTFLFLLALTLVLVFGIGFGFGAMMARAEEPENGSLCKYYSNIEIQSGDTLWDLAEVYMDSDCYGNRSEYIDEVMKINGLTSDRLIAGESLIVPYYSTVQN